MAQGASGSPLANNVARKRQLANVRTALLDGPGTKRRGGPPPPTAPAQDRTTGQEITVQNPPGPDEIAAGEGVAASESTEEPGQTPGLFDPDTRARLLEQAQPFLTQMKLEKMAQLHKKIGRARRFWGGGL